MKTVLIINGFEFYSEQLAKGELSRTLTNHMGNVLKDKYKVLTTTIQDGYTLEEEFEKLQQADIVIFHAPIFWISIPTKFKIYIDKVLGLGDTISENNLYGGAGCMKGKKYILSTTWNASKDQFNNKDGFFEDKSVDDVLISFHKLMQFYGFLKLPSITFYSVISNTDVEGYKEEITSYLNTNL